MALMITFGVFGKRHSPEWLPAVKTDFGRFAIGTKIRELGIEISLLQHYPSVTLITMTVLLSIPSVCV